MSQKANLNNHEDPDNNLWTLPEFLVEGFHFLEASHGVGIIAVIVAALGNRQLCEGIVLDSFDTTAMELEIKGQYCYIDLNLTVFHFLYLIKHL